MGGRESRSGPFRSGENMNVCIGRVVKSSWKDIGAVSPLNSHLLISPLTFTPCSTNLQATARMANRPWKPLTAGKCCTVEDHVVIGNLGRCRPSRADFSKKLAELTSFRRLRASSELSSPGSARFNGDSIEESGRFGVGLYAFQLSELRAITHDFSNNYLLGEGGFGTVHKGYVDDKLRPGLKAQAVAVKLLDTDGLQGHREWLAEVIFLGQFRHAHLVKLIGYCCENEERLLVYEFMPRGSLENHLFRRVSMTLPWGTRLKIALGAAKGLAFLHGAEKPVIYRDFKTSNILLDSDYSAKLSDFGLAKMGPEGEDTHVTTRVMGTHGYAAPEYVMTGHLTTRSDVYSFGVVLLELLTGRRAMDKSRGKAEEKLVDWSRPYLTSSRRLRCIIDPRLAGQYSVKGSREVAALALLCISSNPKDRPRMPAVIETLERLQHLKDMAVTTGVWSSKATPTVVGRNAISAKAKMERESSANARRRVVSAKVA